MEQYWDLIDVVEQTIDFAFQKKYHLNMYQYLKDNKLTKRDVQSFIDSETVKNMNLLIYDLEDYLEGGSDNMHQQLREGYGHIPKPQARKIRNYLYGILEDAWKYSYDRRPGRRKKKTK